MDVLVQYLNREGLDASELDEAVADYMIQLAGEGGTEEEVWSVMEGCYPELEESPERKEAFAEAFHQLQNPGSSGKSPSNTKTPARSTTEQQQQQPSLKLLPSRGDHTGTRAPSGGGVSSSGEGGDVGGTPPPAKDEADVSFLREMMPHVSDRGLRYVLRRVAKGSRVAAASYLADRCAGGSSSSSLRGLEADAEAFERKEQEGASKAQEASRRAEEAKRRDKEERDALKDKIVGRYADEVKAEGGVVKVAIPSLTEKKKTTRYRDGKVVTTTGAKVIVETIKPEWDGGSRGKVKTKGKRGKGFV